MFFVVSMDINFFNFTFLLLFAASLYVKAVPRGRRIQMPDDLVCNNGDDHECVCNRTTGNLDGQYIPCHEFLETDKIDVVSMVLRDINLTACLYTNETYEEYLRRRIAQILSQYCENIPDDCPGTMAEIRSQQRKATLYEVDERTVSVIDDGPVFSKRNIVILRVQYPPGKRRTKISFAVLKMPHTVGINRADTFEPTKVKFILAAQMAPLSRVLGGIRIEQFGIDVVSKPVERADNTKLIIIVTAVVVLFLSCCIIAAVKLLLDRRKMMRQENKETLTNGKSTRSYGTCTEKLFFNNNSVLTNGRTKSKSVFSAGSIKVKNSSKRQLVTGSNPNNDDEQYNKMPLATITNADKSDASLRTEYQNIFVCDHSQLPREDGDEEFEMTQRIGKTILNVTSTTRSPFSSDGSDAAFQFPEKSNSDKGFPVSENIPCVILEDDIAIMANENHVMEYDECTLQSERIQFGLKSTNIGDCFLSTACETIERCQSRQGAHQPFERPLSRRGSRDEKVEEGEEETFNDTREDTPVPLGDEQVVLVAKPLLVDVLKNKTKNAKKLLLTNETDSEQNTDDEDPSTLYKPLKNNVQEEMKTNREMNSIDSEVEDGDDDEEKNDEMEMFERHQYERLLESPMPHLSDNVAIKSEVYFE